MIYTVKNTVEVGKHINVYVNGNKVDSAFYCDTEKGVVNYYPRPYRIFRDGKRVYSRQLRGHVTVEHLN